ncbi:MAG: hypothetical protein JWN24_1681 [Phycisphaerales bacterium]|nr:hypothetical protein [Phycisphaerales bacterium]
MDRRRLRLKKANFAQLRKASKAIRLAAIIAVVWPMSAFAQDTDRPANPPASGQSQSDNRAPVTREEYERLLAEQREMRAELEQMKRERAASQASAAGKGADSAPFAKKEDLEEIDKTVQALRADVDHFHPGTEAFLIAGDASLGYTSQHRNNSTFFAKLSPLVLFKPTDRLLIEGAVDLGLNTDQDANSSTSVDLTIADASYLVTDWLAVGGGLFVTPFGVYHNHFDPPWINKFPDDPLAFSGSLAPGSSVGFFARGAFPLRSTKLTYDVYVTNGPNLIVKDPAATGTLNFDNFSDLNNNKAVGGRIGFLPVPNMELGYSIYTGEAQPSGFPRVRALLQAFDVNWRPEVDAIAGTLDFRAEWVFSDVSRATFDANHSLGFGPVTFNNYRDGGYVQLCYRPTKVNNPILRNFELAGRWDFLKTPTAAPGGNSEQRYTLGLDYWLNPQTVLKAAYEWDRVEVGSGQNGFFIQLGIGL